jgi:hypothetical protein
MLVKVKRTFRNRVPGSLGSARQFSAAYVSACIAGLR